MLQRERIVRELEKRAWGVRESSGYALTVRDVLRNPADVPTAFPSVSIFELSDRVEQTVGRHFDEAPSNMRVLALDVEFFLEAESDESSGSECFDFYEALRWAIFYDGWSLGGVANLGLTEVELSPVVKPGLGNNVVGACITFNARYTDDLERPDGVRT